jgi:glycosyltransferase involved in cell wall biosynthesis
VITVSSFGRQELIRELSVPPARIDVIPNGLGARRRAQGIAEPELRERHRLGSRPVALAVASDLPHKNLGALIEALTLIPVPDRPILVITGPGTDAGRLSAAARAADVHEDVRLLGFRPPEELEGLYTLASCVVLPSLYEGFGLPVLEAMSRGVPVACSDIPVLREVAGVAALFFPPTAAGQIASAIGRLTRDEALRRRAADAGRRHAATFTWAKAAQATLDCYRRTLEVGRPAA